MDKTIQHRPKSRSAMRRARYREIATVVWEERLMDLVRGTGLEAHLPAGKADEEPGDTREKDLPLAIRVRHALERLGPVFIKMGQLLSTRSDLLPPALIEELAKLQDNVPAVPWPPMRARLEAELGAPIEELFGGFDETPLAAASIGQVYRATLPDGTPVAVKVQRPGVSQAMDIDLDLIHDLAGRLVKYVEWAKAHDVDTLADDFAALLRSELDYTQEGRALDRFRSAFADDPALVFPQVYWDLTTSQVLTMDLIEGVPYTDLAKSQETGDIDRARLAQVGVGVYFRMFFQLGFYHADPHAGNLFALPGGRLGFVDCGRVATLSERNRETAFDMIMAILDDDPVGLTEAVLAITGMPPHIDLSAFEIDINALLTQYRREPSGGGGLDRLMKSLLQLMRTHQLRVPAELAMLLGTLGVLEGVALQVDPSFRTLDVAKPLARKLLPERYGPERLVKASLRSARAYGRFLNEFPVQATRALRRVSEGEFRIAVRPNDYEALIDRLMAGFYLLAYALIVGAMIVGFGFLVGRQDLTQVERIGYRGILFAATASVIGLLVRLLHHEWRKFKSNERKR